MDEWRNSTHGNNNESEDEIKFTDDMEVEFLEDKDTFDVDKILEERTVNNKVNFISVANWMVCRFQFFLNIIVIQRYVCI